MRYSYLLLVFLLSSCLSTAYVEDGWKGGFTDTQINEDTWKVTVGGNAYTKQSTIRDYAILRASEVTLEQGYKYFVIYDDKDSTKVNTYTTSGSSSTTGRIDDWGNINSRTTYNSPQTNTQTKFGNELLYRVTNVKIDGFVNYDAQLIYDSLSAKYIK